MEGLKEALQYITGLKAESMEPKLLEINGETYCTKDLTRYHRFPIEDLLQYLKKYENSCYTNVLGERRDELQKLVGIKYDHEEKMEF